MELFIDECRAEMDASCPVSVSVSVASITSPEYGRTGYTKGISIPMTAANRSRPNTCSMPRSTRRGWRRTAA